MNIGLYKKPRLSTVLITLYFCGVVISACVLYTLQIDITNQTLAATNRILGVTMFIGIIALFFTAKTRQERVVYLNRKEEETKENNEQTAAERESLIDVAAVKAIIDTREDVPQRVLNEICKRVGAGQGAIYTMRNGILELTHGYAMSHDRGSIAYNLGEGMVGRVAVDGRRLCLDSVPKGYITVYSGLGNSSPRQLVIAPVKDNDQVKGVIEIASFYPLNEKTLNNIEECAGAIATGIF